MDDNEPLDHRFEVRKQRRDAGVRSAKLARLLVTLKESAFVHAKLDDELKAEVQTVRAMGSDQARRRAERRLAGMLRAYDMDEIDRTLTLQSADQETAARAFHRVQGWRDELVAGDGATVARFLDGYPQVSQTEFQKLVNDAKREASHGSPRGAAKKLFRFLASHIDA
jgi:ribosome-associated protein